MRSCTEAVGGVLTTREKSACESVVRVRRNERIAVAIAPNLDAILESSARADKISFPALLRSIELQRFVIRFGTIGEILPTSGLSRSSADGLVSVHGTVGHTVHL